jgi:nucleotide-binding universal stress UspA family protein
MKAKACTPGCALHRGAIMSEIRTILLHLDASNRTTARVAAAADLAERLDATATALFSVSPSGLGTPAAMSEGVALLAMLQELDAERLQVARERFDAAQAGPRVHWQERHDVDVIPAFCRAALTCDLLVLGQHDPADPKGQAVPPDFAETVLIDSGKPAIVLPYVGEFRGFGRSILVAWKPTRESARALAAALPLLRRAERVHVASWDGDPREVEHWLLRHGIDPVFHREAGVGANIGEALLSRAAELGADMLVMGCYGHSRARELVLGGASRTLLTSMTVPVLMAH